MAPARAQIVSPAEQLVVLGNIEFLPFIVDAMLPYYYSLAHIVVQPSLHEAASLPTKEAMACETPVIDCYGDGSEDDIGNRGCGLRVPHGAVEALSDSIVRIPEDEGAARRMGRIGRERVLRLFTWDKVADSIYASIQTVLNDAT